MGKKVKKINLIGLCVDVRNSTKMIKKLGSEKTADLISNFITGIYKVLRKKKYENFLSRSRHQGDGIIMTLPIENDENFKLTFELIIDLEKVLRAHTNESDDFIIGMGLDFGENIEKNVDQTPKGDKSLIVGNSISRTIKICSQVPFNFKDEVYIIKCSKSFFNKSEIDSDDRFECELNNKKTLCFIKVV